ncbi:hypothetical protein D1B31_07585 [Neobacillus notoginsengisoli]|uniref:Uncharacterized protein n=1 Tax=Neobacillus notoginsengisoli TaxID=1578198 RepID=A0A417YWE0_9BACI|nr:hypothetical protein [Neobacillus notoginsengisoli]RHW41571.1 hypothetical protein D1B31_07585 [Neobacillus notoginsengisoli]
MSNLVSNTEKRPVLVVTWAIILFVSSFFMPYVIVFLIHNSFFQSREQWLFEAPGSGYLTFMIGMIWIPIVMILHVIIQSKYKVKYMRLISMALISLSIPFLLLGATHYYYIDNNGLHFNELKTFNKTSTYEWSSLKEVKQVYAERKEDGSVYFDHYEFITGDNKQIIIPYEVGLRNVEAHILEKLKENHVKVSDNYLDS